MLAGAATVLDRLAAGSSMWRLPTMVLEFQDAPAWAIWGVVAVLSLFRKRRPAAVGAWLGTLGFLAPAVLWYPPFWDRVVATTGWMLLGALVAAALTWSPGPRVGTGRWQANRRARRGGRGECCANHEVARHVRRAVPPDGPRDGQHGPVRIVLWSLALALLVAGVMVAGSGRTREGRRAALVLSVPVVVSLLMLVLPSDADLVVAAAVCTAVPLVALLGVGGLPRRIRVG